jgi:hypothetical protein
MWSGWIVGLDVLYSGDMMRWKKSKMIWLYEYNNYNDLLVVL